MGANLFDVIYHLTEISHNKLNIYTFRHIILWNILWTIICNQYLAKFRHSSK